MLNALAPRLYMPKHYQAETRRQYPFKVSFPARSDRLAHRDTLVRDRSYLVRMAPTASVVAEVGSADALEVKVVFAVAVVAQSPSMVSLPTFVLDFSTGGIGSPG